MTNDQVLEFNSDKICFEVNAKDLGKVIMAIGGQCNKWMYIEDTTPCRHYSESTFRVHYLDRDGMRTMDAISSEETTETRKKTDKRPLFGSCVTLREDRM